ncbi:uncharacterized protein LOC125211791 isoform X1 [Salvia hispanica]|uniref:uncharacterized protein LOC125211791 isoform X1 n=1 Tax=Salvia hispanica TaxID=49212 RepID=UPI002009043A|nr:uncharacterized protein LOC125211791 isoform X1 [Salvia hispanica]XP_047967682.1 uncharacterized protein LOC125211791 isoform X1 [Salvia hispanica]
MPGNEFGDRVHNFFAQDNSPQGQHQSHGVDGNWPVSNSNFWVGSPRPVDVLNSSTKNYSGQNPEIDRGQSGYPAHSANGLNFPQPNLRPDFSRIQPLNEQQYSNGYMYGNQYPQGRQNEGNFRELDAYSDQRHLLASRDLPVHELHRISGHEQPPKASDRSGTSVSPVSFDLFGGQQQMNHHQQASMLQALQRQQSGLNDMQQLQQQLIYRKMEELQRQQQLQQLDSRPQTPINQVPQVTKQASGSQSSLFNGSPNSDALRNPWTAEPGTNWLGRGSAAMQGSPGGTTFLPNLGQTHRLMDMVHQQDDQSLYGVPVSNPRGLAMNQYSPMVTERSSTPQMPISGNSLHSNQHNFLPDRLTRPEGTSISRQNYQNDTNEHGSSQSLNTGIMNIGFHQQVNSLQNNASHQDRARRQELSTLSETSQERYPMHVSSPQNEVTLDPAEEKILYGSDDNIWSAFGKLPSISAEAGNLFDSNSGISNGAPSLQSGSWSALMQSAVAETSTADVGPQEEWSGLNYHNNDGSSANQSPLIHNVNVKQSSLPNDRVHISSATGTESIRSSDSLKLMGLNQLGHTFQEQPSEAAATDVSQRFGQAVAGTSKWLNHSQVQNQLGGESDIHGNALGNAVGAERNGKNFFADWPLGQGGTKRQPNGGNVLAAVPPAGDRSLNAHDAERVPQNQNNQVKSVEGQMADGGSLWKPSPLTSAVEFGSVRSMSGNHQVNKAKGDLGFHNAATSAANSFNMVAGDGAYPFAQNNYLPNQWKHASPSTKSQGGESLGRMMDQVKDQNQGSWKSSDHDEMKNYDRENCAMKENSNDSHRSNLSNHASGSFRESGPTDAIDSRSLSSGKQKSSNPLAKKGSAPRKFQYHPMGNLDDDAGSTHGLKQHSQAQATPVQSAHAHFGQLKLFGQVPRNSAEKGELPKDNKRLDKESSGGSFTGYAAGTSNLFSQSFDSSTNKASSPSQNMLELLHKVDVSSQPPEAENSDGSAGHLQRSQSSFSKGFGLQLGPPSQLLQIPDLSSSSQNAQSMENATRNSLAGIGMGEKSMHMASSLQSRQFPNEKSQMEYENNTSAGPRHPGIGNSVGKGSGNYHSALTSDIPYMRSQLQSKQATRPSTRPAVNQHIDTSFSYSTSLSMERGSTETVLPDTSGNVQKNSLPSSGGTGQQSGPHDVQKIRPAGTASSRDQMRSSQHFGMSGISRQGSSGQVLQSMPSNVPTPQHPSVTQYPKGLTNIHELPQPNILESSSRGDLDVGKGGHIFTKSTAIVHASIGADEKEQSLKERSGQFLSASKTEVPLGSASSEKNHLDDSPANSASTQKDIEDFGRSLKPNTFSNENFALLNQMRVLKHAESDPSLRFSKRLKGPENIHDIHQSHLVTEKQNQDNFRNSLDSSSGIPPEDSRVVTFSTPSDMLQRNTLPHGNAASEDVVVVTALHGSQSKPPADPSAVRAEHHMVSPQMAPSWFNQYGSFKNGSLPMQNIRHAMSSRPEELPFAPGTSSSAMDMPYLEEKMTATPVEAYVSDSLKSSAPTFKTNEHISSPPSMQMNATGQQQVILRPKKRKSATSELLSWYEEITHCSLSPSILSVVEANWTEATNRLAEKVEDDIDLIEDGPPLLRSKRRLILTTQLIQQLFPPPPATVFSADAISEYESVAYAVSRVALGDACSALSTSSNLGSPPHDIAPHVAKGKLSSDPRFAKVIEEFLGKAGKLENDFLRPERSTSILDLRLECQDLEKFSVINRFARFHGRGQTDNAETSTDATAAMQKPCAQKYVTAVPMPRSLPDRVQCLSL